jgi:hypothetical protein
MATHVTHIGHEFCCVLGCTGDKLIKDGVGKMQDAGVAATVATVHVVMAARSTRGSNYKNVMDISRLGLKT